MRAVLPRRLSAHKPSARPPCGLVIAPTRELANQVRTELAWLFARAKIQVAAFTGGSDLRQDLRKLHAGVDIVVGTPGRLVDLLSRGALKLDAVQTAVLDEADEMLDMGFHEDLKTLLGAATARTRTHMFSATLPKPILSLAANYQKHAVRLDARKLGEPGDGSHEDIRHVAHLIAIGDRTAAVINVLRQNADQRAIVFGTTRDGVADLHRELVRQGFRAVVLSGRSGAGRAQSRARGLARGRSPGAGGDQRGRARAGPARGGSGRARGSSTQHRGAHPPQRPYGPGRPQGHQRAHRQSGRAAQGRAPARRRQRDLHLDRGARCRRDRQRGRKAPGSGA
jgi:superfamily II DNA/RNA helicase